MTRFVYFAGGERTTTSGQAGDVERARRHRSGDERLLWFTRAGHEYVVRDAAFLDEMQRIWLPVRDAGADQGAAGAQLGDLGSRVGDIGSQQAALAARVAAAALREAAAGTSEQRADAARERQSLNERMQKLQDEMSGLTETMGTIGERASRPEPMPGAAASAETETMALVERAIAAGSAEQVR